MKKFLFVFSVASASLLTGCDNENSVNPQPLGKAKITGTVFADFDYTNNTDGTTWDKVANTKLIAAITDYSNESVRFVETTTDANGNYTIEVEIGNRPLEVEIQPVDFKANVKTADGTEEEIFYGDWFNDADVTVVKGGEFIRDIYYND